MELLLKSCLLRPFRPGDEDAVAHHANDHAVWRNLRDRFPHPYTRDDAATWVSFASAQDPTSDFAIDVDGAAVGAIGITLQTDVHRHSAEIGYWLGAAFHGRGIATEALRAMTDHAFATFDLYRLFASVFAYNAASVRVLEKAGYVFEGRLRKNVVKDGVVVDQLLYAMVR